MRGVLGGGRGEINFSNFFLSPSFHNPLLFHDSAPEECRLPWKPFLGPLVGGMSGLLSLERLWQGEPRECFEDGLYFCRIFSRQFILSLLCGAVRGSAFRIPREPEGPRAPGTRVSGLPLALPHVQPEQKKKLRQDSKMLYRLPFQPRSAQGSSANHGLQPRSHPCTPLDTNLTVSQHECDLQPRQTVTAPTQHTAIVAYGLLPFCP